MTTALAIFVKTPGHSPVKTRLAAGIGEHQAMAFHRLAARAVAEVACAVRARHAAFHVYWAVAEHAALEDASWRDLPRCWQGEGSLGGRLHRVYSDLLARHERVLLVGADAPQLTVDLLRCAVAALDRPATPFALGEADDGGFWLFGGCRPVPAQVWNSVGYSQSDTTVQLRAALQAHGDIAALPSLADVDQAADLAALVEALARLPDPLPTQRELMRWLIALDRAETQNRAETQSGMC